MVFLYFAKEYITYTRYLNEIKVIEQCHRKKQLSKIGFMGGSFTKVSLIEEQPLRNFNTIFEKLTPNELQELKERVKFINEIHLRLKQGELKERDRDDCVPLAAHYYNTHCKTIAAWNQVFSEEELRINLPTNESTQLDPSYSSKTIAQTDG